MNVPVRLIKRISRRSIHIHVLYVNKFINGLEILFPRWLMYLLDITKDEKQPSQRTHTVSFWGVYVFMQHRKGLVMLILYAIDLRHLHFFWFYALTFGHEKWWAGWEIISWVVSFRRLSIGDIFNKVSSQDSLTIMWMWWVLPPKKWVVKSYGDI